MTYTKEEMVRYRVKRALESLDEARLMMSHHHVNASLSRMYYACFYAVSALLLEHGMRSKKHSGIRSLFGRHFLRTGVFSKDLGKTYNDLYDCRQECDYEDLAEASPDMVAEMLPKAEAFVAAIRKKLEEEPREFQ